MSLLVGYGDEDEERQAPPENNPVELPEEDVKEKDEGLTPESPRTKKIISERKRTRDEEKASSSKGGFFANLSDVCQKQGDQDLMPPPPSLPLVSRRKKNNSTGIPLKPRPKQQNDNDSQPPMAKEPDMESQSVLTPTGSMDDFLNNDGDDEDTVLPFFQQRPADCTSGRSGPIPKLFTLADDTQHSSYSETLASETEQHNSVMLRPVMGPSLPSTSEEAQRRESEQNGNVGVVEPVYAAPVDAQQRYDQFLSSACGDKKFRQYLQRTQYLDAVPNTQPNATKKQKEMCRMSQAIEINADSLKDPNWMQNSAVPRTKLEALAKQQATRDPKALKPVIDTKMWTPSGYLNMRAKEPNKLAKSKHQITWLAQESVDRELEMMEKTAHTRQSKYQTQMKYGW